MMTQKVLLPVIQYDEFPGHTRKLTATVRMSDLRKVDFPLNANVRRPTKNYVVSSILSSIEHKKGVMVIDAPIFVACEDITVVLGADRKTHFVEMTFQEGQGVLDGGHRLFTSRLANIDRGTYDTDNVFLQFQIESGLSRQEVIDKAVALNTSKNPSSYEISNFRGEFDWFKDLVAGTKFKYIQYYSGHLEGGFEGDSALRVTTLLTLPQLVDPKYNPYELGASNKRRHPMFLSASGSGSTNAMLDMAASNRSRFGEGRLMIELMELYCEIYRLMDARCARTPMPFVTKVKDSRKATHLPDGTVLTHKHPSKLYISVILSCFRLLMNDNFTWKVNPLHDIVATRSFMGKLITKMRYVMGTGDRANIASTIIQKDVYTWDLLYAEAEKHVHELTGSMRLTA